MSILTLAEYKLTPYYVAADQSDANISYYLDIVDDLILAIRGIDFFEFTGDVVNGSAVISNIDDPYENAFIGGLVESTNGRGKIMAIDKEALTITVGTASTGTAADETITIYPRMAQVVAAEIVKYLIANLSIDQTMKSESIGTYSYTRGEDYVMAGGYSLPGFIAKKIQRYQIFV